MSFPSSIRTMCWCSCWISNENTLLMWSKGCINIIWEQPGAYCLFSPFRNLITKLFSLYCLIVSTRRHKHFRSHVQTRSGRKLAGSCQSFFRVMKYWIMLLSPWRVEYSYSCKSKIMKRSPWWYLPFNSSHIFYKQCLSIIHLKKYICQWNLWSKPSPLCLAVPCKRFFIRVMRMNWSSINKL